MIKTKIDASVVINAAIASHRTTWGLAKNTKAYIIDMEPPFDDEKLKDEANWSSNWNFGTARAKAQGIISKNVSEVTKSASLCDIVFEKFDKEKHGKDKVYSFLEQPELIAEFSERIGAILSEKIIESEPNIDSIIKRSEFDAFLFGYSAVVSEDTSIFPSPVSYRDIAFEDHTNADDIKRFVVFDVIKGSYLYNIFTSMKSDSETVEYSHDLSDDRYPKFKSNGWNEDALEKILCKIFTENEEALSVLEGRKGKGDDNIKLRFESWEDINLLSKEMGDIWCGINTNNVYLAKIYEINEDGDYMETYCVLSGPVLGADQSFVASIKEDIVYQKEKESVVQKDVISIIVDSSIEGSRYIHDIKGSGKIVAEAGLRVDILRNTIQDKLVLAGSTWIYAGNSLTQRNMDLKVIGGVVVLGQGTEVVPNMVRQELGDHLSILGLENQEHNSNMSHIDPNTRLSNRPTKDEVNFVNSEAYSIRSSDIPVKLKAYGNVISSIVKKLVSDNILNKKEEKIRDEFINSVIYEFSDMDLDKKDVIKILETISGVVLTPVMSDRQAIQEAMSMASTSSARNRLTRMYLSTFGFNRRQIRDIVSNEEYGKDAELAAIENAMFNNTKEVVFSLGQDHMIHIPAHFFKIDQKFKGIEAGEDPVSAYNYVLNALSNTELHISAIGNSVFFKNRYKDFNKAQEYFRTKVKQLAAMLDQMKQESAKEGSNQNEGELTPELKNKFYLDRIKLIEKINMSKERAQASQEMKSASFQFDQELKAKKLDAEIENKSKKAETDVNLTLAKKSAEMTR